MVTKNRRIAFVTLPRSVSARLVLQGVARFVAQHPGMHLSAVGHPAFGFLQDETSFYGDGVIGMFREASEAEPFLQRGLAVVGVGSIIGKLRPWVHVNDEQVGRLAAEELLGGHLAAYASVSVALTPGTTKWQDGKWWVQAAGTPAASSRRHGFHEALRRRRLESIPVDLACEPFLTASTREGALTMFGARLKELPRPLGIFCDSDLAALLTLEACRRAGLLVPRDVLVVGSGNDELLCGSSVPTLTSVDFGGDRLGWEAARLLIDILDGKASTDSEIRVDPVSVIRRQSTAREVVSPQASKVAAAIAYMQRNLQLSINIDAVARHLGLTRRSLEMHFNKHRGCSPAVEFARIRMEQAKTLLADTDMTTKEIAFSCGFHDVKRLFRTFKREIGQTPREYRLQQQAAKRNQEKKG
jgi:LacI family transcriptional regulator